MAKTKGNPVNYAFIDSQNLNLGIRDQGWRLDFARFRIFLKDKYKVFKAFLFIREIDFVSNLRVKLEEKIKWGVLQPRTKP